MATAMAMTGTGAVKVRTGAGAGASAGAGAGAGSGSGTGELRRRTDRQTQTDEETGTGSRPAAKRPCLVLSLVHLGPCSETSDGLAPTGPPQPGPASGLSARKRTSARTAAGGGRSGGGGWWWWPSCLVFAHPAPVLVPIRYWSRWSCWSCWSAVLAGRPRLLGPLAAALHPLSMGLHSSRRLATGPYVHLPSHSLPTTSGQDASPRKRPPCLPACLSVCDRLSHVHHPPSAICPLPLIVHYSAVQDGLV